MENSKATLGLITFVIFLIIGLVFIFKSKKSTAIKMNSGVTTFFKELTPTFNFGLLIGLLLAYIALNGLIYSVLPSVWSALYNDFSLAFLLLQLFMLAYIVLISSKDGAQHAKKALIVVLIFSTILIYNAIKEEAEQKKNEEKKEEDALKRELALKSTPTKELFFAPANDKWSEAIYIEDGDKAYIVTDEMVEVKLPTYNIAVKYPDINLDAKLTGPYRFRAMKGASEGVTVTVFIERKNK